METQLDLFKEYSELNAVLENSVKIERQMHNVRKCLFGKLGNVFKTLVDYDGRLVSLEMKLESQEKEIQELREYVSWQEAVS